MEYENFCLFKSWNSWIRALVSRLASLMILFCLSCSNVSFSRSQSSSAFLIWPYNLRFFSFLIYFWWFLFCHCQFKNLYSVITFSYNSLVIFLEFSSSMFATLQSFCNPKPPNFTGSASKLFPHRNIHRPTW